MTLRPWARFLCWLAIVTKRGGHLYDWADEPMLCKHCGKPYTGGWVRGE